MKPWYVNAKPPVPGKVRYSQNFMTHNNLFTTSENERESDVALLGVLSILM